MSDNENVEGYVVEGDMPVSVRGFLTLYSVSVGRVSYEMFVNQARLLGLGRKYVPKIRRLKDSFANAKNRLNGMHLLSLEQDENWDGIVRQEIVIERLKRSNEYAVQVKLTGRSRGKLHTERRNVFRMEYDAPEDFDAVRWRAAYMDSFWNEDAEMPDMANVRQCLTINPYWEDMETNPADVDLLVRIQEILFEEFLQVATSIDEKMLRDDCRRVLHSLKGIPFRSGSGAWFVPNFEGEESPLETLENYSSMLEAYCTENTQERESDDNWYDAEGRPRNWYRGQSNLRIMGYIDNERQLEYLRRDISNNLSREVGEYHDRLLKVANEFNDDKVEAFEARLNNLTVARDELQTRLGNLANLMGGDIGVNVNMFADIDQGLESRLASITGNNEVVSRLRGLTNIEITGE